MGHIPGSKEVEHSLKETLKTVKISLQQINSQAGKLLSKGNYPGAEELISVAKKVGEFEVGLDSFRKRWKEIKNITEHQNQKKEKPLPLWQYYIPILQVLQNLGGVAQKEKIEQEIGRQVQDLLPTSEMYSKGKQPRWIYMTRHALGAMEKEGFVQRIKKEWRIMPKGRKAVETNWKEKKS